MEINKLTSCLATIEMLFCMLTCSVQVYKLPNVSRKTPTQITVTSMLFLSNTLDKDLIENNVIFELFTNDNTIDSKVVFFKCFCSEQKV